MIEELQNKIRVFQEEVSNLSKQQLLIIQYLSTIEYFSIIPDRSGKFLYQTFVSISMYVSTYDKKCRNIYAFFYDDCSSV